jgi:hypothetical protein
VKPKPDVSGFALDPNAFLDGAEGEAGAAPARLASATPSPSPVTRRAITIEVVAPEATVQKLFRLRWSVAQALRAAAVRETDEQGRRVTETEIVERLLRQKFMEHN